MTSALATMRVDYDQVKIKDLDTSSNPLLNKRRKKAAAGAKSGSTVCQSQWDPEDWWRGELPAEEVEGIAWNPAFLGMFSYQMGQQQSQRWTFSSQ